MSGPLIPALTPEQWAIPATNETGPGLADFFRDKAGDLAGPCSGEEDDDGVFQLYERLAIVGSLELHAAAALCLDGLKDDEGRNLGFCWEDVDGCRTHAIFARHEAQVSVKCGHPHRVPMFEDEALAAENRAARIAALLPPRVTK